MASNLCCNPPRHRVSPQRIPGVAQCGRINLLIAGLTGDKVLVDVIGKEIKKVGAAIFVIGPNLIASIGLIDRLNVSFLRKAVDLKRKHREVLRSQEQAGEPSALVQPNWILLISVGEQLC